MGLAVDPAVAARGVAGTGMAVGWVDLAAVDLGRVESGAVDLGAVVVTVVTAAVQAVWCHRHQCTALQARGVIQQPNKNADISI